MKKSCGLTFLLWLVLAGAYGWVAWWRIQEVGPAVVIGILGGTFAAVFVGGVMGFIQGLKDREIIRRAQHGAARVDGRLEAVSGPIRPLGAALEAPFSGTPCVAYQYEVRNRAARRSDFAGVGLSPCVIDTPSGPVKLLGWADLGAFGGGTRTIDPERAATHLRSAKLEPLALTNVVSTLGSLLADDDGSIRKDFQIENASVSLAGRKLKEKVVQVGQTVTALGIWSAAKGGFTPLGGATMNRLLPGASDSAARDVVVSSAKKLGGAFAFFLALHAILVPMYILAPGPPKKDRHGKIIPKGASVFDERDCERLEDVLAAGADPNEHDSGGRTALMNAVSNGKIDCVRSLVAAGARPDLADEDGSSAMTWAITADREDLVAILKQAGGRDFRVTAATGRPVQADSEPVQTVLAYDAAIQAGDLDALGRVSRPSTPEFVKKYDVMKLWQHTRPARPEFVEGFENDSAATIAVQGTTTSSAGKVITFHYQLVKSTDGWHVDREWFQD